MKKMGCFMWMILLLVWMLLAACAPMQKTVITNSNLPTLKGTWSGWTTFRGYQGNSLMTTLEIFNDNVPIEGRIIIHHFPAAARNTFGIPLKDVMADNSIILKFNDAKITDDGTLLGTNGQNYLELTYYEGEKQKLDGPFYFYGAAGTTEFTRR
jgi:hypothetical protein